MKTAGRHSGPPRGLRISDYDYPLPRHLVARYPSERRDESRLLVVDRRGGDFRHLRFRDLPRLLEPGDVLVLNESRVLPVRLLGRKPTGAEVEVFLLRPLAGVRSGGDGGGDRGRPAAPGPGEARVWEALVRPGGKLKPGRRVVVAEGFEVEILDSTPGGGRVVRLVTEEPVDLALERHGRIPLPPYLERDDEALDRERYQTVYARVPGSVAAPTAGLHFTRELLEEVEGLGVEVVRLVLHVGVGTFRPLDEGGPIPETLHAERYEVSPPAAAAVNAARARGGRVWAVGTTVVRTLETLADEDGRVRPGSGETTLFIRPPYRFRAVDRLVTNFHLPRSTLLMLVAAFGGYETIMYAYRTAVAAEYRFYSYGDAMVIL